MRKIMSVAAVVGFSLAACGHSQTDVADKMMKDAEAAGIEVDRSCVDEVVKNLSKDDISSLEVGKTPTDNAEKVVSLMNTKCLTEAAIVAQLGSLPDGVDQQCVLDAVHNLTIDDMADPTANMIDAMTACVSGGG